MDSDLYARLAATGRPECPQCGYSLEGLPGPHRCPECGRPYGRDILTWRPTPPSLVRILSGIPLLVFFIYQLMSGLPTKRALIVLAVILLAILMLNFLARFWRTRDCLSIDDESITYSFSGVVRFNWSEVDEVDRGSMGDTITIYLKNGKKERITNASRLIPSKQTLAFLEITNAYAAAASEAELSSTLEADKDSEQPIGQSDEQLVDADLHARLAATGRIECPQCGYSLEGLPGPYRCPECNYGYEAGILAWRLKRGPGLLPIIAMILTPCILYGAIFAIRGSRNVEFVVTSAIWLGMVGALLYERLVRRRGEFLTIDDKGITWRFDAHTRSVQWKHLRAARLSASGLGVQISTGGRFGHTIPRQLSILTSMSVDQFLAFVRSRCQEVHGHDSQHDVASDLRDA